jgi:predicted  nucleic acid-binding Zn-ribbon protein
MLAIFGVPIYNPLMSQGFHLFQLQKIDSLIDQANARSTEINTYLEQDKRLEIAKTLLQEKQEVLRKSQNQLKKIEQEVATKRSKLEQSENNLYSGRIHIPKELQDIQNEVAALKRFISTLEDKQLEAMLIVEADQAEAEQGQENYHKVEGEVATDQSTQRGELNTIAANKERLLIERDAVAQQITSENQLLYEKLRKSRRGIAVAAIVDESCSACGSTLTPAECQVARSPKNIVFCPSCGRIVYGG